MVLAGQQFVKQDYQQGLAGRLAEDDLEAEIRERVYKVMTNILKIWMNIGTLCLACLMNTNGT